MRNKLCHIKLSCLSLWLLLFLVSCGGDSEKEGDTAQTPLTSLISINDHSPQPNQTDIDINSSIEILLSAPIEQHLSDFSFTLSLEESEVEGKLIASNNLITFTPTIPLNYSVEYVVNISAKGDLSNRISPYQFSFSTFDQQQQVIYSFHPKIRTFGKTSFSLIPIEQVKPNESVKVSFGIPFPKGYLRDIKQFRVLDESNKELDIAVKEVLPWRNTDNENSIRSALVQLEIEFTNNEFGLLNSRQLTLEWGVNRTSKALSLSPVKEDWVVVDDEEYLAEDKVFEPFAYAIFQPQWYGDSVIKTRLLPMGTHPDLSAYDSAFQLFGDTAINRVDPRVIDDNLIPHRNSYAAWLFDRAMTIYQLAFKTGEFKYIRAAHRASQFYLQQINEQGYFSLKSSNDMKYSYGESLVTNYILQGDPAIPAKIEQMVPAWNTFNINYTLNTNFWTERHAAFKLLGYITAYEVTGKDSYFEQASSAFSSLKIMQDSPQEGIPKTGALMHTSSSHGEGGSHFIASPWMSALLLDAVERYFIHFEDDSALSFTIKMADFFKQDDVSLYEWTGWKGLDSYYIPHYLAGSDLSEKEHGGNGSLDLEHTPDVIKIFSSAYFSSCALGNCDDSYLTTIAKLYNSAITYTFPYWIRAAAPSAGYSAYRLAPPRKFNWWFKSSANIDFLIGEKVRIPLYKSTAPELELIQKAQISTYQPNDEITFTYQLSNLGDVAAKNIVISANILGASPENLLTVSELPTPAIRREGAIVWKIEELSAGEVISDLSFTVSVKQFPTLPTLNRPLGNILSFANLHYCRVDDSEDICQIWQSNWDLGIQPYLTQSDWQLIAPSPPLSPPSISIISPIMHDALSSLAELIAEVDDPDTVAKVEFWLNEELLDEFTQPPYQSSIQSNALADKEHIYTVKAWDTFGSYNEDSVTVSVQVPDSQSPVVEIISPVANENYCDVADIIYNVEDNYTINGCTVSLNNSQKDRPECGPYKVFKAVSLFKSQAHLTFDEAKIALFSQDGDNLIGNGSDISYKSGYHNNAIYFDSDSSEVNFDTTNLDISNDITVSFWLKPDTSEGMLISQEWGYIGAEKGWAIYLGANNHRNNNELSISWSSGNNLNNANDLNVVQSPSNSITLSQWQHVVVRKQGAEVDIFINGELSTSQTITYPNISWSFSSDKLFSMAKAMTNTDFYNANFQGGLDELAIWNEALTDDEIAKLYSPSNTSSIKQQLTISAADNAGNIGSSSVSFTVKGCE